MTVYNRYSIHDITAYNAVQCIQQINLVDVAWTQNVSTVASQQRLSIIVTAIDNNSVGEGRYHCMNNLTVLKHLVRTTVAESHN